MDAIMKLPTTTKKKSLEKVNILVIRFAKTGKLGVSKPCENCIKSMLELPNKKGYKIQRVYYSQPDETIERITLRNLSLETTQHVSRFYKRKKQANIR